ncbi:MAG TPA: hypothetical protein VNA16_02595 [Abditibacteriaceae bacterium]|nr:hypothetical protein [Abditibacteriaceae bacterium]
MDIYKFSLYLGFTGMAAMALLGASHIGQSVGHGHGGAHDGGAHAQGHGAPHAHGHSTHGHDAHDSAHGHTPRGEHNVNFFLSLLSPRVFFGFLLGFGATGMLLPRGALPDAARLVLALGGGCVFEHFVMAAVWNFVFRFASNPARTLESAVCEEARAVTNFDAGGDGLIAVDLDGQVVQLLGTLTPEARSSGVRVRTGDRLFIEAVDTRRNSCTVSLLHS